MTTRRLHLHLFLLYLLPVTVIAPPLAAQRVAEVQIAPPFMRMVQDAQAALVATAYDPDGNPANATLRWASSNINIATVDSAGTVHALTPGAVVITVTVAGVEGRRPVVARASVFVMRPLGTRPPRRFVTVMPGDSGAVTIPPPGQAPGQAPGMSMPAIPMPAMPPGLEARQMDSAIRANVNCGEPFMNSVNPGRACYDRRAMMKDSAFAAPPRPTSPECQRMSAVVLFLEVDEKGIVNRVLPFSASGTCQQYLEILGQAARTLTFTPAQKADQPIRSWVRMMIHPR